MSSIVEQLGKQQHSQPANQWALAPQRINYRYTRVQISKKFWEATNLDERKMRSAQTLDALSLGIVDAHDSKTDSSSR
jgi:hypothetical protein